jgi:hypothetical protein
MENTALMTKALTYGVGTFLVALPSMVITYWWMI